jgi:hypothetical protein
MKKNILFVVVVSGMLWSDMITLKDLQWKNRVLLVFPRLEEGTPFKWEVSDTLLAKMEERDLIYFVFGDSVISNSDYVFESGYAEKLRSRYTLGSKKMCWVLLGKDGGSKLKKEGSVPDWQLLFATIDAMPMRQREMNRIMNFN